MIIRKKILFEAGLLEPVEDKAHGKGQARVPSVPSHKAKGKNKNSKKSASKKTNSKS